MPLDPAAHAREAPPLGALAAFVPVAAMLALSVARTRREDETLRQELDGYAEYATAVRHRLLPGTW